MNYAEMHQTKFARCLDLLKSWGVTDATITGSFVTFTLMGVEFRLTEPQVRVLFQPINVDVFIQAPKGFINVNTNFTQPL